MFSLSYYFIYFYFYQHLLESMSQPMSCISTVMLIHIQLYTSIFKLVAKKPEIIFIYLVKIHNFIIIQDAEVFIENVFLSQSFIISVLPPWMDEVRGGHLLGKELLLLLNILKV